MTKPLDEIPAAVLALISGGRISPATGTDPALMQMMQKLLEAVGQLGQQKQQASAQTMQMMQQMMGGGGSPGGGGHGGGKKAQ
jgi:hypothetical protein